VTSNMSARSTDGPATAATSGDAASGSATLERPLLRVRDLRVDFGTSTGLPRRAVRGVNLTLEAGSTLAIVGESGSGKTVTGRALIGLVDPPGRVSGSIRFDGQELVGASDGDLRVIRGTGIGMVFQDSLDSLNPVFSVGSQLSEIFRVRLGRSRTEAREEAAQLMEMVGIVNGSERLGDYPHQFSGGMRQRICIAMAMAMRPRLLIADEPTTALDVTVQAGILRLLRELQQDTGMALIFVTHDLAVARVVAHRLAVMYAGQVVEEGPIEEIYHHPAHPYTRALLASEPDAARTWSDLHPIPGNPPESDVVISGCSFHPRCSMAQDVCRTDVPALRPIRGAQVSRCHLAESV
jgi:oligopeptide/dipeptide ABC transporter ATP-binding protein